MNVKLPPSSTSSSSVFPCLGNNNTNGSSSNNKIFNNNCLNKKSCTRCCLLLSLLILIEFSLHALMFPAKDACVVLKSMPRFDDGQQLPKIIHLQWQSKTLLKGSIQERAYLEYKRLFPAHEVKMWTDGEMRDLIKNEFDWFLDVYDAYPFNIQRVDASRYFIIYKYGGLYADTDYIPFHDFWNLLSTEKLSIIESPYKYAEEVQNSLFSAPPRLKIFKNIFELLIERKNSREVVYSTGPNLIQDAALADAYLLPCEVFFRVPPMLWDHPNVLGKFEATYIYPHTPLFKNCGKYNENDKCMMGAHLGTSTSSGGLFSKYAKNNTLT